MFANVETMTPLNWVLNLLSSPLAITIYAILAVVAVGVWYMWITVKPKQKILYCSEEENQGQEFTVKRKTPAHLYTKKMKGDVYRFLRFRDAFTFNVGLQNITRWFAKKGTAYTKQLETGDVGEFTLYKIMETVWGNEVVRDLTDDMKQKLIESEVMITVRLEEGHTPKGYKDEPETYFTEESDEEMMKIFGITVGKEMHREDYIRTIALVGCGVALALVAQGMGIIGSVAP